MGRKTKTEMLENPDVYGKFLDLENRSAVERTVLGLWCALEDQAIVLEQWAIEFKARAESERSALRQAIVRRHQAIHGPRATIKTSDRVIVLQKDGGSLRLAWSQIWFSRRGWRKEDRKPRFRSIPTCKEGTRLDLVLKGAHEDEIELLRVHEMEIRKIKAAWQDHIALKAKVRSMTVKLLNERERQVEEFLSDVDSNAF